MLGWVWHFGSRARDDLPSRTLRPLLTCALVTVFGLYGVAYLSAMVGVIATEYERLFYQISNLGSKFVMLMCCGSIRSNLYNDLIVVLLCKANTQRQATVCDGDWEDGRASMD
mmetsp:Transcript_30284/g.76939  ORF Transcript_30284/g.76939 Transcript_30284/m.76939 type:complete len:113 (+) Transcript_30284:1-339(+)